MSIFLKGGVMSKRLKTSDLPKGKDLVKITKRWDKQVAVSPVADKGRKEGCLCIHTDSKGKTVMCERLKNNISHREKIEKDFGERACKVALQIDAVGQIERALQRSFLKKDFFADLSATDPCPIASMLYEIAKAAPAAMGIAICAGYLPPEEQAVLTEIKVGASEKTAPFISKEDVPKLNRDMKTLREQEAASHKKRGK